MATVREYFEKGFQNCVSADLALSAATTTGTYSFGARIHLDFDAHAIFSSVFIPSLPEHLCDGLLSGLIDDPSALTQLSSITNMTMPKLSSSAAGTKALIERDGNNFRLTLETPDGNKVSDRDLVFTKRLYIYSQDDISPERREKLDALARNRGLTVSFRSPSYAMEVDKMLLPKAFVSHDSRDKDEVARPIALGLQKLQCPVWYDEFSLHVGDSLRESIEKGLKTCKFCILVLTPNFLSKGGWPKREYDTAFTREIIENSRLFLPVWHNVTKEEVFNYSPILADRLGVTWSLGADEVCRRLYAAIERVD